MKYTNNIIFKLSLDHDDGWSQTCFLPSEHAGIQTLRFRFLEALVRRRPCAADGYRNVAHPREGIPDEFERSFNVADSLLM
ncbi:hypothetical protein ISN45_Aa08g030190 [Arabidopsis thaliana x Arabidopsis arenosa]|uniref:Uncharacterized protein n=1 Tax=Arabidopsis thaliana x Arabidopsis arenosa TaxID=1240361 RepID=A0A8T1XX57_9BRAS|nr:hypothetical protein ISN45_Aa08g030190 [Arabidopsis thaliana x Arabidopsis arenosa]